MIRAPFIALALALAAGVVFAVQEASAQLFGGASGTTSAGVSETITSANQSAGVISGSERFLRRNRRPNSFVGRDRLATQRFVGRDSSVTRQPSAVTNLPPSQNESTLNRPWRPSSGKSLYDPQISVGFDYQPYAQQVLSQNLTNRLKQHLGAELPIEVSVADRTATLRGTVASATARGLAEILMGFEPGISTVVNQLQVADSPQ
jgi:hypothetical protein